MISECYGSSVTVAHHRELKPKRVQSGDITLFSSTAKWWREQRTQFGVWTTLRMLAIILREFLRDSTPERRRQRFGDADYDWEFRVDTTSANVSWQSRLIGFLNSSYQPIESDLFQEMLNALGIDYTQFTFIDIGSGKGRPLLMASRYPFRRILGVELLPELNRIANDNIRKFRDEQQRCSLIESIQADATAFEFPVEPLVVFLFNPLPEAGTKRVIENLARSVSQQPRAAWCVYANPVYERVVLASGVFRKTAGSHQYSIYRNEAAPPADGTWALRFTSR